MKKFFLITLLLSSALIACEKENNSSNGDIFEIKMGQTATVSTLKIRLDSVQDSRCPEGAVCVRAGEAIAKLTFIKGNEQIVKSLEVTGAFGYSKPDTVLVFDKKAILIDVLPYPNVNTQLPQSDYKVQIKLE